MPPIGDAELEELLRQGVEVWNATRPSGWLNLADLDLNDLDLRGADLRKAGMWGCNLQRTDLSDADLRDADLNWANLCRARLIGTDVTGANFRNAWIYGSALWDLKGSPSSDVDISIVPDGPNYWRSDREVFRIATGGLRIAPFLSSLYSTLTEGQPDGLLSELVNGLTTRIVLVLGRFTNNRATLDRITTTIRNSGAMIPLVFDFARPISRDLTESVTLWARLCHFMVADLSNPSSVPHELASIIPFLPSVRLYPIIQKGQKPYAMFEHLLKYPWVHEVRTFSSNNELENMISDIVTDASIRTAPGPG